MVSCYKFYMRSWNSMHSLWSGRRRLSVCVCLKFGLWSLPLRSVVLLHSLVFSHLNKIPEATMFKGRRLIQACCSGGSQSKIGGPSWFSLCWWPFLLTESPSGTEHDVARSSTGVCLHLSYRATRIPHQCPNPIQSSSSKYRIYVSTLLVCHWYKTSPQGNKYSNHSNS